MRVLYVAPRYHTNQIPVVKGWIENGHQVKFISQFAGTPEDYSILQPVILGYSKLFEYIMKLYRMLFCRKEKSAKKEFDLRVKAGFPPLGSVKRQLGAFQPELVIVRERSVYNIPFTFYCRKRNIPVILYNQSPLWDRAGQKAGWKKKALLSMLPQMRITPVLGFQKEGMKKTPNSRFVPFVMETHCPPEERTYFRDDKIQLLCVGRYEGRKNLLLLVDAVKDLILPYKLHLTIIGEATDQNQKEYLSQLKERIKNNSLEEHITLLQNCSMEKMYEEYKRADLFVLPSTKERASISQLEAMSCSLPVICSDTNGSACYVSNGVNGFLFRDNDMDDLQEKLKAMVSDRSRILAMGRSSYELVCSKYQFRNYYEAVMECLREGMNL
ncbi:MAG: glycosyltransferase family 4 protein [Lachnospiraceae bacterium]|nr:glycosyltransferase family 4 protein [Lachnospiraceae bacterium]